MLRNEFPSKTRVFKVIIYILLDFQTVDELPPNFHSPTIEIPEIVTFRILQ
jgi:hypothetical protein